MNRPSFPFTRPRNSGARRGAPIPGPQPSCQRVTLALCLIPWLVLEGTSVRLIAGEPFTPASERTVLVRLERPSVRTLSAARPGPSKPTHAPAPAVEQANGATSPASTTSKQAPVSRGARRAAAFPR